VPATLARESVIALVSAGWCVAVTGARGETDHTRVAGDGAGSRVLDLAGQTDLADLADIVGSASAIVTGNTGPMHLAAAVATPVVAVFAPVVPVDRWRPWQVPHIVLGDTAIACAGCRSRVCPMATQRCVADIRDSDVVDAVSMLTASSVPRPKPDSEVVRPVSAP
jgi:ADP-heptose:LPS heptosyltransferase